MTISYAALMLSLTGAPITDQAPPRTVPDAVLRRGRLSFDGRATTGSFTGSTTSVQGRLQGGKLSQVRGWAEAPVSTLTTGDRRRDRDLNKSLESSRYPTLRFELTALAGGESAADSANLLLHGRFTIHGVTRDVVIPASVAFRPEGIRVRSQTGLNLKDYKIGGLSRALGLLRMSEEIVVHIDLTFGATSPGQAVDR